MRQPLPDHPVLRQQVKDAQASLGADLPTLKMIFDMMLSLDARMTKTERQE